MEAERWLPVAGFEGLYEASDLGRVRSLDREVMRKNKHGPFSSHLPGRVMKAKKNHAGRLQVTLGKDGKKTTKSVHRLVLEAFEGPSLPGYECCHYDDDPTNNRLENLRWGTRSENEQDKVRNGKHNHSNKTHCPRGHEYSPENTYWYPNRKSRDCRACWREKAKERRKNGA